MLYIQQVFTTNVTTISLMSKPYGQNTPIVLYEDTFPITDISSITAYKNELCKTLSDSHKDTKGARQYVSKNHKNVIL